MKNVTYFLFLIFIFLPGKAQGQCNVAIPSNAEQLSGGGSGTLPNNNNPVWCCQGVQAVEVPLNPISRDIFLEPGTEINIVFLFRTHTIWAKDGADVNANAGALTIYYENFGNLNLPGGNHTLIQCASIIYDYTNAPSGICLTLPVDLLFFKGKWENNQVELNWETATELNNEGFEVQRGTDLEDWETISWVEGQGTTVTPTQYSFVDRAPEMDQLYYRLMQVDFDGKVEFSPIVAVSRPLAASEVIVAPNPADRGFFIRTSKQQEIQSAYLVNELGQVVWYADQLNEPFVNTNFFPEGFYVLSFSINGRSYQKKVLIKR
jgi:hypothetical protein